jgi:hypothetical protein
MIVQAINTTGGILAYNNNGENVSIGAGATLTIPNTVLVQFQQDPQVLVDITAGNLNLSDGISTYLGSNAVVFLYNAAHDFSNLDKSGSGTVNALNGAVIATVAKNATVNFKITGTWSGTLSLQGSLDGGLTWDSIQGYVPSSGNWTNATTTNFMVTVPCGAYTQVQLVATAWSSGTATIKYNSSLATNAIQVFSSSAAAFSAQVRNQDTAGNGITSTAETSKQSLDVNIVAPAAAYYSAPVNIRQTAATAANATVWSMRNASGSTKTIYLERIFLSMAFDGATPLTRTSLKYDLVRYTSATPTGGTAITVVAQDSSSAATQVTDVRFLDTGLTTTGVSFGTPIATIICPETDNGPVAQYIREAIAVKLAPGEGFCIRLDVAAVVGQSISGEIVWSER